MYLACCADIFLLLMYNEMTLLQLHAPEMDIIPLEVTTCITLLVLGSETLVFPRLDKTDLVVGCSTMISLHLHLGERIQRSINIPCGIFVCVKKPHSH